MNRVACPWNLCKCGFSQDSTLFPALTNSRVQTALIHMNSTSDFYRFLQVEWVSLSDTDGRWNFPSWVCMRIRDKLLTKMGQLWIGLPRNNLFSSNQLLPATGPDDEREPSTGSGGIPLTWESETVTIETASKLWGPDHRQLRFDE